MQDKQMRCVKLVEKNKNSLKLSSFNISSLIDRFDSQLFRSIAYPDHCLHYLLPEKRHYSMLLRPRTQLHPKPHQHYPFQEHLC